MDKDVIIKKFRPKLRKERLARGLSQEALAYKAGLHRTYIGMVERGEKNITLMNIKKICEALNLKLSSFFKDL
ncbi:MAG: helix-turn-helix transcriptional regulator [Halobacteria archaeon]